MAAVYKVITKHTKEVLKDFVKFTYRVNHPKATYQLCVLGTGFLIIGMFLKDQSQKGMMICGTIGLVMLLFTLNRHWIGFLKLAKVDENYKNQSEMEFLFSSGGFTVASPKGSEPVHHKYSDIIGSYKDAKNYYIMVSNEVFLLPRKDFASNNQDKFDAFIEGKTGKIVILIKMTTRQKLQSMLDARELLNEEHERKEAEKKAKKEAGQ